jgi:hypothetical protein
MSDDRESRAMLLRLMAEQKEVERALRERSLRGKTCPIQRPMRDRWV